MSKFLKSLGENIAVVAVATGFLFAGFYIWLPLAAIGLIIYIIWLINHGII